MAFTKTQVSELYVTLMGRASEGTGNQWWQDNFDDQTQAAEAMLNSDAVKAYFGDSITADADFIANIYKNTLNKTADGADGTTEDAAGIAYWIGRLDGTTGEQLTRAEMIVKLIEVASASTTPAGTQFSNRVAVSDHAADTLTDAPEGYQTSLAFNNSGTEGLVVTDDATTTTAADAIIDGMNATGEAFSLTKGTETLVGTDGADTFTGMVSNLTAEKTLDTTDSLDGGAGEDTLNVTLKANFTGLTGTSKIQNIETIALTNDSTIARTFDNSGVTGVTKYTIDATKATVNLTDMAAVADVELSNQASGTFTTKFATGASELTATTDSMKLALSTIGTAEDLATTVVEEKAVTITLTDIETANVTATNNNVVSFAGTDLTTLNIDGAGDIKVNSVATSLTALDASAVTGTADVNVTNATAKIATVKTGKGDDKITVKSDNSVANATIEGGDGADTLVLDSSAGGTVQYAMTGVETVALGTVAGALTFSGSKSSDITTISTKSTSTAATSFVGMGSANLTLDALGATVDAGDLAVDTTGTTTLNYTADATSVTAKTAQTSAADFAMANSSEVTINVGEYIDTTDSDIVAAKATAVTLNVASGKDTATTPVEITKFGGTITAAKATSIVVDAKGALAASSVITAAIATTANITNGSTAADLDLVTAKLEELTVISDSSFTMTGATDFTSLQNANVTINNGHFDTTGMAMAKVSNLTVTGAGTDTKLGQSQATFNNLGGDNSYALTVAAEGLKGGLTIGTMDASSGQDLTVDATKVTGDLTIGNISATVAGANVNVNAAGAAGTIGIGTIGASGTGVSSATVNTAGAVKAVTVGAITSTGAVNVNLKGNLAANTIGAITAKSVVIDASDTIDTLTIGATATSGGAGTPDITVTDSLTYTAGLKGANAAALDIETVATSTAATLTLNGNIGDDKFDVSVANNTGNKVALTIKGDLDIGTNAVVVRTATDTDGSTIDLSGLKAGGTTSISITGSAKADIIKGATAATTIDGAAGIDTITAGAGGDTITGGAAVDVITLGAGADKVITGSTAADADSITGFTSQSDIIDLSAALTAVTLTIGTQVAAGAAADSTAAIALVTTAADTDAEVYYIENTVGSSGVLTLTQIETAMTAGGAATGQATIIIDNGTDTLIYTDQAAETDAGSGAGLILQATLVGVTGATALATADLISV